MNKKIIFLIIISLTVIGLILTVLLRSNNFSGELIVPFSQNIITINPTNPIPNNLYEIPPLSLDDIFKSDKNFSSYPSEKIRVLIATGDVIPARSVNYQANNRRNFRWPFEKTAEVLRNADLTLINLESPLVPNCLLTNSGMVFCGDVKNIEGLTFAGVDVASLANNHLENYGEKGVTSTVKLLEDTGILPVLENQPQVKDVRGLRFGFAAFHDLIQPQLAIETDYADKIASQVAQLKKQSDVVIVSFHWSSEYTSIPSQRQKDLAHWAIDNGADLIIGNHPHWIQPVEIYHDKLIVYAHGNFVFDQMWSEKTKEGVVGKYTFLDNRLIDAEFLPVKIVDFGQPYFLQDWEKEKILKEMKEGSSKLSQYQSR